MDSGTAKRKATTRTWASGTQQASSRATKKTKEEEKRLSDKIETLVPESKLYNNLVELERKLDYSLNKRKLEVQEALRVRPAKSVATVRLTIYNTAENQEPYYHSDISQVRALEEEPSWTLRLEGKPQGENGFAGRKFSTYFEKIFIQLDKELYPEDNFLEWHQISHRTESDGFEVKKKGNKDFSCRIILYPNHRPAQYKLSTPLSALVGLKNETRSRVIMNVWQYIKVHKLQDPENRKIIILNPAMKEVFNCEKMQFLEIPELLSEHLTPLEPFEIEFHVSMTGSKPNHRTFDVQVQSEEPSSLNQSFDSFVKEVESCEEQANKLRVQINQLKKKRDFYMDFCSDPVKFMNDTLDQQVRDFKLMQSDAGFAEEEERHSKFYYQPYVMEAVSQYVQDALLTREA